MQEKFIDYLKSKSNDKTSFIEEIASVLDIGYDAAYRRINNKTNLSLEESVKLAKHYKISLNKLFEVGSKTTILADLSPPIHNKEGLEIWLKQSYNSVFPLTKLKSASIIYSAKDIPLFHTLKDSYLSRYKIYVWLKDVDTEMTSNKVTFDEQDKRLIASIQQVLGPVEEEIILVDGVKAEGNIEIIIFLLYSTKLRVEGNIEIISLFTLLLQNLEFAEERNENVLRISGQSSSARALT